MAFGLSRFPVDPSHRSLVLFAVIGGIFALDEIGRSQEKRSLVACAPMNRGQAVLVIPAGIRDDLKDDSWHGAERADVDDQLAVFALLATAAVADRALYGCVGRLFAVSALAAADFSVLPADGDAKFFRVSG